MMRKRIGKGRLTAFFLAGVLILSGTAGCGGGEKTAPQTETQTESNETQSVLSQADTEFTDQDQDGTYSEDGAVLIQFNGSQAEAEGDKVSVSGTGVSIKGRGTYVVSGKSDNGQIIVEAGDEDEVQIVLKDAELSCETSAALYVKNAGKVFLTLAEGSFNRLSGGTEYKELDGTSIDGVIFSKGDLTINGTGSLEIDANYKHGIVSKDDLIITGGELTIDAVSQCLAAKDRVKILNGTFLLTSSKKAVKSENTEDSTLGNIYVAGGNFTIKSEDDAFHASGSIRVDGGTFDIESGDDAFHGDQDLEINGGTIRVTACKEGLEAYRVQINGGDISIIAADDAVNAAAPDSGEAVNGESTEGRKQAEGSALPEGKTPPEGKMPPESGMPPQGEALSGEAEQKEERKAKGPGPEGERGGRMGPGGGMGGGSMENDENAYIKITGGTLLIDAGGDGLDSNGSLFISGGTVLISGPVSNGDGALDYNGDGIIDGGTVIALGSLGMVQGFGDSSSQCSIQYKLEETKEAGCAVTLTDEKGTVLADWTPQKSYSSVVISCPELKENGTYKLTAGEESGEVTLNGKTASNFTREEGRRGGMPPRGSEEGQAK